MSPVVPIAGDRISYILSVAPLSVIDTTSIMLVGYFHYLPVMVTASELLRCFPAARVVALVALVAGSDSCGVSSGLVSPELISVSIPATPGRILIAR